MNTTYDKKYLKTLVRVLEDDIKDLSEWDAYNDDSLSEEVFKLKTTIQAIKYNKLLE